MRPKPPRLQYIEARFIRIGCVFRDAVTKLSRYEWQRVVIRKQKGKSEGENELPGIVSSY